MKTLRGLRAAARTEGSGVAESGAAASGATVAATPIEA
jgi:hypothetical protein